MTITADQERDFSPSYFPKLDQDWLSGAECLEIAAYSNPDEDINLPLTANLLANARPSLTPQSPDKLVSQGRWTIDLQKNDNSYLIVFERAPHTCEQGFSISRLLRRLFCVPTQLIKIEIIEIGVLDYILLASDEEHLGHREKAADIIFAAINQAFLNENFDEIKNAFKSIEMSNVPDGVAIALIANAVIARRKIRAESVEFLRKTARSGRTLSIREYARKKLSKLEDVPTL